MVGEVLAERFELQELVGTGGMSSVFRAHDRLLDRYVALKILHQQYNDDPDYVERFRREARAVAALSHPNIVTVIDRAEHDGRQFIVFEYVDGRNLKQLLRAKGALPVDQALELAMQVASALAFAHQQGLVHRDVKPQNVLLNGDGQAKVTDFGIARSLDVQHGGMTQTGTVLGTSDYIAPEQAQGKMVDAQTDVYALGVVLYELLTGSVPFAGENFVAVAMRHINDPPPSVRELRPEVPERVDAAVRRAMAKNPSDRFASMADFGRELEACLAELSTTQILPGAVPTPARRSRREQQPGRRVLWPTLLAVLGIAVLAAVVAVLVLGHRHGKKGQAGNAPVPSVIALKAVTAYDPFGTPPGQEHNADAPRATDASPATYWETETYDSSFASLGKPGVGLVLDAQRDVQIHKLGVASETPGFRAVVRAGESASGPFPDYVSQVQTAGSRTIFPITGGKHRFYVLWITQLPPKYPYVHINDVNAS